MKFSCDKCHTRYSIADERVRGRVLKIRCKTCNHVITVREEAAASLTAAPAMATVIQAVTGSASPTGTLSVYDDSGGDGEHTMISMPPEAPRSEPDDWYVAFDGEQEGPLSFARVCDRVRAERGHREAHCWRPGYLAWLAVEEVPELAAALELVEASPSAPLLVPASGPLPPRAKSASGVQATVRAPSPAVIEHEEPPVATAPVESGPLPLGPPPQAMGAMLTRPEPRRARVKDERREEPASAPAAEVANAIAAASASAAPAARGATIEGSRPSTAPSAQGRLEGSRPSAAPSVQGKLDSGPAVSPFAAAMQASSAAPAPLPRQPTPTAIKEPRPANDARPATPPRELRPPSDGPRARPTEPSAPKALLRTPDTGPAPLPPPPGDELVIGEASGLINLSHLAKAAMPAATAPAPARTPSETFGGVPVTPPNGVDAPHGIPATGPAPVVVMTGPARGAPGWTKWAAAGGGLVSLVLAITLIVLLTRKPAATVVAPPPGPTATVAANRPTAPVEATPVAPPPAAEVKRAPSKRAPVEAKRPPGPMRSASPPAAGDQLTGPQKSLAALYRDDVEHGAPRPAPLGERGGGVGGADVAQQSIGKVVTQNKRSLNVCYDRVLKHDPTLRQGRVMIHVKVGLSGNVTGVSFPDPAYANSELAQCLSQTIRHWHFPSASDEYETEFPIILQSN